MFSQIIAMFKLKFFAPSHSIKFGSFETWVLVVVSDVKAAEAESALSSYLCLGGITNINKSFVLGS
jgi:hypothetical protein